MSNHNPENGQPPLGDSSSGFRRLQYRMGQLLLINVLAAAAIPMFIDVFGNAWDYLVALAGAALILTLVDLRYGRYLWFSSHFILYLLWEILVSNISMTLLVLQPRPRLDPGIVAIPLTVQTELEITVLATAIVLTPGSLVVDLGQDAQGRYILYVQGLRIDDPEQFRRSIQQTFERLLLRISQGVQ